MRWRIFAIGKPKLVFARTGIEEYLGRLKSVAPVQVDYLKSGQRESESALLLEKSQGMFRVVLDERGDEITSRELAGKITSWEQQGSVKEVALLIGGADGHTPELRAAASWRWSLSRLTLQHEMALLLVLEQVYRAYSIKAGAPYHRD
ncbi:MAG: 23S rRNA (pseudouridine(1915)-N(3))-methyltransferase RlmH [Verrucomicrobiota bacterium]